MLGLLCERSGVAFRAVHFFPHLSDVNRVLEFKALRTDLLAFRILFSLRDDDVAGITIMRDGFSGAIHMLSIMAPVTSRKNRMSNIVWIGLPIHFHFGKEIL